MQYTIVHRDPQAFQQAVALEHIKAMCERAFGTLAARAEGALLGHQGQAQAHGDEHCAPAIDQPTVRCLKRDGIPADLPRG